MRVNKRLSIVFGLFIVAAFLFFLSNASKTDENQPIEPIGSTESHGSAEPDSIIEVFDSYVKSEFDSSGSIGAAVVIVKDGQIALMRCMGVRKKGKNDSINEHTVFRLASVSKTFAGVLAGMLSGEDILPLNTRIKEFIPGFRLKDSINTTDLTVEHILSHTSGLVPHAYDNLVEAGVPFREIMDSLFRVQISAPPGVLYGYQNVVFSLFDTLVYASTGNTYTELLENKIFSPLHMYTASAGYNDLSNNPNRAFPHRGVRNNFFPIRDNDRYYMTGAAAGINASISDLANYLQALLGNYPKIIDNQTIDQVLEPRVISPLRWNYLRKWNNVESKHYALGWRIINTNNRDIAYHGGYVRGYRAEIAVCREENFGIAFLCNSPNSFGSGIIPMFLDLYFNSEINQ